MNEPGHDTAPDPRYTTGVNAFIALPDAPSVVAGHGRAAILTPDGELLVLPTAEAAALLKTLPPPILVHAPATFRRLAMRPGPAFDLLDLFAFVRPAHTAAPTPRACRKPAGAGAATSPTRWVSPKPPRQTSR